MKNKNFFYHLRQAICDPKTGKVISQEEYGKILGFPKNTICVNEKKGHKPSFLFAYAVSKATGIPLEYIAEHFLAPYWIDPKVGSV